MDLQVDNLDSTIYTTLNTRETPLPNYPTTTEETNMDEL